MTEWFCYDTPDGLLCQEIASAEALSVRRVTYCKLESQPGWLTARMSMARMLADDGSIVGVCRRFGDICVVTEPDE